MEHKVTFFTDVFNLNKPSFHSVWSVLRRIRDGSSKDLIEKVRVELDKEKRNKLKMGLPAILFSGEFSERNRSKMLKHSGLIVLDFDDVEDVVALKAELSNDPYIFACWYGPSGKENSSLKCLVRIPNDDHLGSFLALQKKYPNLDKSGKDTSRICYESYDPDIYTNKDSKIFLEQVKISHENIKVDSPETDNNVIYEAMVKWMDGKGEYFSEGNRNNFLAKLAGACNRMGIPKSETYDRLYYDYVSGSSSFKESELKSVVNSIYKNYASDFNTSTFSKGEMINVKTEKLVTAEVLDMTAPPRDVIYLKELSDDMLTDFRTGKIKRGEVTYFSEVDDIFRWIKGEVTALYGIGNHGKTTIMYYLMMLKSIHDGDRWTIFSPEQYPPTRFYRDLIQMYIGKSVMGKYKMSEAEFKKGMDFVQDHFSYLYPRNDDPTPDYILDRLIEASIKQKSSGTVIDPFNQLYHDFSMRDDQNLSRVLSKFKKVALQEQLYFVVITHPNGMIETDRNTGEIMMPYYYKHMAGGPMWSNKCDNILCYHRPVFRSNPEENICLFASQKIKDQQTNGKTGVVYMQYNSQKFQFEPVSEDDYFKRINPEKELDELLDALAPSISHRDKESLDDKMSRFKKSYDYNRIVTKNEELKNMF